MAILRTFLGMGVAITWVVIAAPPAVGYKPGPTMMGEAITASPQDKLYEAYRKYIYVKYCNETRQGYLVVWVNEVELDRARTRVKAIEDDVKAEKPQIIPDRLYQIALQSINGASVSGEECQLVYHQLMQIPASGNAGGISLKKDF